MTWLFVIGLTNAVLASVLAVLAWGIGRYARRPAFARLLWVLVLCKLLTPPLYKPAVSHWFSTPVWLTHVTTGTEPADGLLVREAWHPAAADLPPLGPGGTAAPPGYSAGLIDKTLPSATAAAVRSTAQPWSLFVRLAAVSPSSWVVLAGVAWLLGSVLCLVWLCFRTWRFRRFLGRVAHCDADLGHRVARLAHDAGLSSAPRVLIVESAVSPMLWGAGRGAYLLFPAELARRVDAAACDTLLLHELAHFSRGDWLVRMLELAAQVVYWWHPLVWCALRQIESAEEECCDAWVVKHRAGGRRLYAEALLATLDFLCEPKRALPPAACGLGAAGPLRSRLTQIMCGEVAVGSSRAARSFVLAVAAIALPLSPSIVGPAPREAAATTVAGAEAGRAMSGDNKTAFPAGDAPDAGPGHRREHTLSPTGPFSAALPQPPKAGSWFVPRDPTPRLIPALYATAVAPNGRYQLEARTGRRAALVHVVSSQRLDLSAYRILAASFSPDSRLLATGQDNESVVRLWDADTGEVRALLKGSEATITSVAFAPDATHVAAGAADGSVLIWTVDEEDVVARLPRQDAPVSCLRWSQSGDRLAIASSDWSNRDSSSLVVWRPGDAAQAEAWSLDHSLGALDWLGEEELVVADWSGAARVIDLASGMPVESFWLGKDSVSAAAFSPDCRLMPRRRAIGDGQ